MRTIDCCASNPLFICFRIHTSCVRYCSLYLSYPLLQGNACSGDEDFFEGSEFSQTEFDWHTPKPSESGWGTHSASDLIHPEEKLTVAIAGELVMRPLWAASDVNRSSKDLDDISDSET